MNKTGLVIAALVIWWLWNKGKSAEAAGQTYATGYNPQPWDSQTLDVPNGWQGGSY